VTLGVDKGCTCGFPEFENIVHRTDVMCYVKVHTATEPCVTHQPELRAQSSLPCPWCVIDELKANNERLRLSATAREELLRDIQKWFNDKRMGTYQYMEGSDFYEDKDVMNDRITDVLGDAP
jgi:hypothetical protein